MEGRNACFLANHGVFVCGKTLEDAFEACRALEEGCKTYIEQKTVEKAKADKSHTNLITKENKKAAEFPRLSAVSNYFL